MSAASVTAEQRRGSCKAFLDGLWTADDLRSES